MSGKIACLAALLLAVAATHPAAACTPQRERVSLRLADTASAAEIVTPPRGTRPVGAAVLFAGSDVADLDGAIEGRGETIVSRPLRQIADRLACAGIVSLRYNKRYVTGAMAVDRARFDTLTGADLAADGRSAVAFLRARPATARLPLGLVGWSEGTTVALAVSAAEPDVRALVLIAPIVEPMATTVQRQYIRIGKPYLQGYATDGGLDAAAIARADTGPGGVLAHVFVRQFRGFAPGERINPLLDRNADGRIAFGEADPVIASWYADGPGGGLGMAATGRALPGVGEAFGAATPPTLMLQGLSDGMVDPQPAIRFARRVDRRGRVVLRTYPGLGHSLGPSVSPERDELLPIAAAPLRDLTAWLATRLFRASATARRTASTLPVTPPRR